MGFFTRKPKPAPTPAPTAATPAKVAAKTAPIAITGMGIASYAGDKPLSLICAILGQMNGVRLSEEYKVVTNNGEYVVPRMAPIVELQNQHAQQRMISMTAIALWNAATHLPASVPAENILIVIMAAPELINSGNGQQRLQNYLIDGMRRFDTATFRIQPNTTGSSTAALRTAIAELNQGKWQAVIFGGGDTLVSKDICLDLHEQNRLNVVGKKAGIVPGEGAAFVVLQTNDTAKTNPTPALAWLSGLGTAPESHARDADIEATEGLSTAITQAIAQAGITATDIQGIVHNLGAETVHAFEWYQTTQKLWPRQVSEQQRMAVQQGEIEHPDIPDDPIPDIETPYLYMGELGTATLPMHLATALAWIQYDAHQAKWGFPIRKHLLVCDTPDAAERGAIVISKTLA